jgi:MoaA/NifB/PqqE/SkfB family radical SAM enzyme
MTYKIIKIEPVPKHFSVSWLLGSFCNYDCMYCPPEWHNPHSRPHDLATLKTVWTNIFNKTKHLNLKYKIGFTGGEPTANKSFLPLIKWLREEYDQHIDMILLVTNGSASTNYYTKLAGLIESISFSTHSEFMDEQKFFDKAKKLDKLMVRPKKSFHVNIMNESWNQDRIALYKIFLDDHNISYSVNEIDYSCQTRPIHFVKGVTNLGTA